MSLIRAFRAPAAASAALLISISTLASTEPSSITVFRKSIVPMLEDHCYECHGDGYDKGKVAFDRLESNDAILDRSLWLRVLVNTRTGLMPAEQKPRLSAAEQRRLEDWIKYDVFQIDPKNPEWTSTSRRKRNFPPTTRASDSTTSATC
jgi:hypothetical protein